MTFKHRVFPPFRRPLFKQIRTSHEYLVSWARIPIANEIAWPAGWVVLRARSASKMVMYTHAEKRSTDSVDVAKLLSSTVIVDGEMAPLRNALKGEATIIHFVRNGA